MSDGAFPDRLTQLRNRWENDPSSRIFLQLAEEYRHLGRVKEALEVLERGLKEHPGYLSALVAKGRCLLELNEPEGARGVLERVVKQDATQMVANKLLVRAYIETGDPAKARERLDLYSLLNDSDPEIDELRRRVRAMEQPPQAEPPRPEPHPGRTQELLTPMSATRRAATATVKDDVFDLGRPAGPPPSGGDLFDLGFPAPRTKAVPVPEAEPFAELWAPPAVAASVPAASAVAEKAAPVEEKPKADEEPEPEGVIFPGLASRESRRRYLDHLGSEGLFLFELTPAEPVEAPQMVAPVSDLEPFPDLAEALLAAPAPVESPEPELAAEAWEVVEEVAPEPSWAAIQAPQEPQEEGMPAAVVGAQQAAPWEAEALEPMPLLPNLPAPEMAEPAVPMPVQPVATATLGEIYLRQGHLSEAARIFHEVLQREPDNAAAREGLARLAALREEGRPLEARELLAGYEPEGEAGANARKVYLLTRYLERIRREGARHVS